jgi:poly-gamma-glutamate capsule biosynthesis protein CapA/YwtB (metallophosphatase superfamily)
MKKARLSFVFVLIALILLPASAAFAADGDAPSPTETPPEAVTESSAEIAVTGDIMALSAQIKSAHEKGGGYNFDYVFKRVKPILSGADLAIGNLETPVAGSAFPYTSGSSRNGYPVLNAPEAFAGAVKRAGYDIVSTANNHCLDYGEKGLKNTLDAIKRSGLKSTGTFKTKEARGTPLIEEVKGIKICVLAYTDRTNHREYTLSPSKRAYMFNRLSAGRVTGDIAKARKNGAELVIVMVHWGTEDAARSNSAQRSMAKKIAKAGADIIIGAHPHVLQETARITAQTPYGKKNCFVAYSLGNFVSSMTETRYTDTAILKFTVRKNAEGKVWVDAVKGISATTFSSYGGKRFAVLPYYRTRDFTSSAAVVAKLRSSFKRVSGKLKSKYLDMVTG